MWTNTHIIAITDHYRYAKARYSQFVSQVSQHKWISKAGIRWDVCSWSFRNILHPTTEPSTHWQEKTKEIKVAKIDAKWVNWVLVAATTPVKKCWPHRKNSMCPLSKHISYQMSRQLFQSSLNKIQMWGVQSMIGEPQWLSG